MAPPNPSEAPALSAVARTLLRLRQHTPRHLLVIAGLCLGIALLLTALDGRGFADKLVYTVLIGLFSTSIVNGTRLGLAWLSDRRARARGLPFAPDINSWHGALAGALLALFIAPAAGIALGDWITGNRSMSLLNLSSTSTRITLVLSLLGTLVAIVVISSLERLANARAQAEAAQRQAAEHQLRLLQSQLEPHMLFNTLANLRVLIGLDAARAQAMLDRLIAYLRATLSASRTAEHPLATEFERLNDYLALMAVRMGPRLQTTLDLPAALRAVPVPPLLLQPLVENAIQHGLEPHVQGGRIHVAARQEGAELVLTVRDTGAGLHAAAPARPGGGFGLAQVRERLATLHGPRATLQLAEATDAEGGTLATLRLPLVMPLAATTPPCTTPPAP